MNWPKGVNSNWHATSKVVNHRSTLNGSRIMFHWPSQVNETIRKWSTSKPIRTSHVWWLPIWVPSIRAIIRAKSAIRMGRMFNTLDSWFKVSSTRTRRIFELSLHHRQVSILGQSVALCWSVKLNEMSRRKRSRNVLAKLVSLLTWNCNFCFLASSWNNSIVFWVFYSFRVVLKSSLLVKVNELKCKDILNLPHWF